MPLRSESDAATPVANQAVSIAAASIAATGDMPQSEVHSFGVTQPLSFEATPAETVPPTSTEPAAVAVHDESLEARQVATPAQQTPQSTPVPSLASSPVAAGHDEALPASLPVQALQTVVLAAGLQWVQSDPARVEQARRAMRKMPAPAHAPRVRKPRATQDEGPLLLVETRQQLPSLQIAENNPGH